MAALIVKWRVVEDALDETFTWYTTVDVVVCAVGTTRYLRASNRDDVGTFELGPRAVLVDL